MGAGVRVRESIVLHGAALHVSRAHPGEGASPRHLAAPHTPSPPPAAPQDHTCVLNTIVGWDSTIGRWARVEGTPSDPNPNDPYAKIDSESLFRDGRLTPSITILGESRLQPGFWRTGQGLLPSYRPPGAVPAGCSVTIPAEVVILNSIVLPHKELSRSCKNQIIL